jgi:hypothetical protein
MSHQTSPTPHHRQHSPVLYGSITFTHLEENSSMVKIPHKAIGNSCVVEELSHLKQLPLSHVCKLGLINTVHNTSEATRKKSQRRLRFFLSLELAPSLTQARPLPATQRKERQRERKGTNDITFTVSSFEYMLARCRAEYCSLLVASGLDLEQDTQLHTHTPTLPASSNFG